jgi:hypothetical protein
VAVLSKGLKMVLKYGKDMTSLKRKETKNNFLECKHRRGKNNKAREKN